VSGGDSGNSENSDSVRVVDSGNRADSDGSGDSGEQW
jgi:hypothetical protein